MLHIPSFQAFNCAGIATAIRRKKPGVESFFISSAIISYIFGEGMETTFRSDFELNLELIPWPLKLGGSSFVVICAHKELDKSNKNAHTYNRITILFIIL